MEKILVVCLVISSLIFVGVGCGPKRYQIKKVVSQAPVKAEIVLHQLRAQIGQLVKDVEALHKYGFLKGVKYEDAKEAIVNIVKKYNQLVTTYKKFNRFEEDQYKDILFWMDVLMNIVKPKEKA